MLHKSPPPGLGDAGIPVAIQLDLAVIRQLPGLQGNEAFEFELEAPWMYTELQDTSLRMVTDSSEDEGRKGSLS